MKKIFVVFCTLALFLPVITMAHPGHGETGGFTITHYFLEPVHAVISIGVLALVVFMIKLLSGKKATQKK
ncbi:MAG: hypothetical protein WCJ85_12605 [Chitinophagaceae bacterium]